MKAHYSVLLQLVLFLGVSACSDDPSSDSNDDTAEAVAFDTQGCASPSVNPGDNLTIDIPHEGQTRQYILYVPPGIDTSTPAPLVLNWHGLTSSAQQQQFLAGNTIAEQRNVIVAYPNGLGDPPPDPEGRGGQSFNGGVCCSQFGTPMHQANDVDFGRSIVANVASKLCVDRRRIYSTGMSNGGYMSEHNACQAADLYAAVAPVSAIGMPRMDCTPSRPISLVAFNGTEDPLVDYAASQQSVADWVQRNGCTGQPEREQFGTSYCDTWSTCSAGVIVKSCTVTGMHHCWPGNPRVIPGFCDSGGLMEIDANAQMYDFFARFVLP